MGSTQKAYELDEVRKAVAESFSWREALIALGRSPRGRTDRSLKRFVEAHNISTEHFGTNKKTISNSKTPDELYFASGTHHTTSSLKKRILRNNMIPYICALCEGEPKWMGSNLVLWLDHIDGDPSNNQLSNLRFACPNCSSQMETHGVKRGEGKPYQKKNTANSTGKAYAKKEVNDRIAKREYITIDGNKFSREDLVSAVGNARTLSDVVRSFGGKPLPSSIRKIRRHANAWEISIDHFDPYHPGQVHNRITKEKLEKKLVDGDTTSSNKLKHWLWGFEMLPRRCQICDLQEEWLGEPLTLHMDHINGKNTDNRFENLRILCPNCHSQTPTFAGGNPDRESSTTPGSRECAHCKQEFFSVYKIYCSDQCRKAGFKKKASSSHKGKPRPDSRKVERPPLDEVLAYAQAHGYCAAGRKWGVSDNAIRKWLKSGLQ